MQSNLGLQGSQSEVVPMNTPSPVQAAQMMSQQALEARTVSMQQLQTVAQYMGTTPSIGSSLQQMSNQMSIMQYTSPQQTPFISPGGLGGYSGGGGMMPSPLQTSTQGGGGYRFPTSPVQYNPVPLMPPPPIFSTPFTPQPPSMPMFTTAWEQELRNRESRADSLSALSAQIPGAIGQLGAYGGAAALGAGFMGGRFGGVGRAVGAIGGAALAQFSGVAQGMGNLAAAPWQGQREALEMGGGIERMTSNFVIAPGAQRNQFGPGLNRSSSIEMGGAIQSLAQNPAFKQSTGGMFNQMDLMNIMGQAGQAGLMDQSQSVSGIRRNLQMTAQTIREFMQLTNDPDVSNVIRTMANLHHGAGMNQTQMREAAANMRAYSRSAGMSLDAIQSTGGMMGAATFAQAGLGPGAGYNYGMYSMANARQGVASGAYPPNVLQQLGGVQGIAMRDAQTQAAAFAMDPLRMAASQQTPRGFQFDSAAMDTMFEMPGSFGLKSMEKRARAQFKGASANQLAMYPLQQQEIQDQLTQSMSPQQATIMRYRMAMDTGTEMGFGGGTAFVTGARRLFGDDAARQMVQQGGSNSFWASQQQEIRMRAYEQRAQYWDQTNRGKILDSDYLGFGGVINAGKNALVAGVEALAGKALPGVQMDAEFGFQRAAVTTYESAKRAVLSGIKGMGSWTEDTEAIRHGTVTRKRDPMLQPRSEAHLRMLQSSEGIRAAMEAEPFALSKKPLDFRGALAGEILGGDQFRTDKTSDIVSYGVGTLGLMTAGLSGLALGAVGLQGGDVYQAGLGNVMETLAGEGAMKKSAQNYIEDAKYMARMSGGYDVLSSQRNEEEVRLSKTTGLSAGAQQILISEFGTQLKTKFGDRKERITPDELKGEYRAFIATNSSGFSKEKRDKLLGKDISEDFMREGFFTAMRGNDKAAKTIQESFSRAQIQANEAQETIDESTGTPEKAAREAFGRAQASTTWAGKLWEKISGDVAEGKPKKLTDDEWEQTQDIMSRMTPLRAGILVARNLQSTGMTPGKAGMDALKAKFLKTGGTEQGWRRVQKEAVASKKLMSPTELEWINKQTDSGLVEAAGTQWMASQARDTIQKSYEEITGSKVQMFNAKGKLRDFGEFSKSVGEGQIRKMLDADTSSQEYKIGKVLETYQSGLTMMEEDPKYKQAKDDVKKIYRENMKRTSWGRVMGAAGPGAEEETTQLAPGMGAGGNADAAAIAKAQSEFVAILKGLTLPQGAIEVFNVAVNTFAGAVKENKSWF